MNHIEPSGDFPATQATGAESPYFAHVVIGESQRLMPASLREHVADVFGLASKKQMVPHSTKSVVLRRFQIASHEHIAHVRAYASFTRTRPLKGDQHNAN